MNLLIAILVVLVLVLLICTSVLAVSNVKLWIKIGAIEKSTHQITYIDPMKANFQAPTDEEAEQIGETDFNNIQ